MRGCLGRGGLQVLAGLVLMLVVASTQARMQRVKPGEVPQLDADEGLVVLAVDTDIEVHSVKVLKEGKTFGAGAMRDIPAGRSLALYIAPAGQYQWRELNLVRNLRYGLADDSEFGFKVEAGRITYAGDLLFRPITVFRADIGVVNRSLAALDWLRDTHPRLGAAHPFVYVGHYPDPFPEFYRAELARHPQARPHAEVTLRPPPPPPSGGLPLPVEDLFRAGRLSDVAMNPAGTLLALELRNAKDDYTVELIDLQAQTSVVLAKGDTFFRRIAWAGDDRLLLTQGTTGTAQTITVVHIETGADGARSYRKIALPKAGMIIDPLPEQPRHILFGSVDSRGVLAVHRMDITSQATVDALRTTTRSRLNAGVSNDIDWYADGHGTLRLAIVQVEGQGGEKARLALMHGADGAYTEVLDLSEESAFVPVGLSFDGSEIHGLSDKARAQRDLVAFDVASRRITRTLFTRPGVDVVGPLYDSRRNVIGATYYEGGRLVSEYFATADRQLEAMLAAAFPDKTVMVAARSRDGGQLVLWVDAGDHPARLYHMDVARREAALLQEHQPWLPDALFAPSRVVRFTGNDGLPLEAFLTLPAGGGKRPLVVFPHGGPIGVADRRHFNAEVQLIASLGYAVLQVNYRGSEGYGKAFREAGHRNYGTGIEDDLDAAIRHVVDAYPVDETRMCMLGASYGGYSSLVSAVRWPGRFRCAVSMAGVSDLALFFTASDSGRDAKTRELLEKIVGNPHTDMASMQRSSPLYNYEALRLPVMLVHGREDRRVDYEHTRRMLRMLDMAGNPPVGLVFDDEGHDLAGAANRIKAWEGVAGFLRSHLDAPAAATGAL